MITIWRGKWFSQMLLATFTMGTLVYQGVSGLKHLAHSPAINK